MLLDPRHFEARLQLARVPGAAGQRREAAVLLAQLEAESSGQPPCRVRAAQLRLQASLRAAWLWLRARVRGA